MEEYKISIATDYSLVLGGRYIRLGDYSGEDFYNKILEAKFTSAFYNNKKLIIELDGTKGYPSSFLDQSFGELARIYGEDNVRDTLIFKTNVFQWVVEFINKEIWNQIK